MISTLDPRTALVVIDLQVGIMAMQTAPQSPAEVVANAAKLARAFRERSLPVILVNVAGLSPGRSETPRPKLAFPPNWTDLAPELDRQPTDLVVTKYSVGGFYGTSLELHLRRNAVTQIVFCGIATGSGVESTARDAHDRGFHLTFVTDAMADRSAEVHDFCVERVMKRIGETGTTADVLAKLAATR